MQVFENHFSTDEEEMAWSDQEKDAGVSKLLRGLSGERRTDHRALRQRISHDTAVITLGGIGPGQKQTEKTLLEWAKTTYPGHVGTMTAFHKATPPPHSPNTNPPLANPKGDQAVYASYDQERFYGETPPIPFREAPQPVDDLLATAIAKDDMFVEIYETDAKDPANSDVIKARNAELEAIAKKAQTEGV